jgi:small subunit ribosomal protein S9
MPRTKKATTEDKTTTSQSQKESYIEAIGRRKTAVARVRLFFHGNKDFIVNEKQADKYFQENEQQTIIRQSLDKGLPSGEIGVSVLVRGGGMHVQAEAVRQGIARALVKSDSNLRSILKALGYLTRDARARERKKFGLKRARRARQWRKR